MTKITKWFTAVFVTWPFVCVATMLADYLPCVKQSTQYCAWETQPPTCNFKCPDCGYDPIHGQPSNKGTRYDVYRTKTGYLDYFNDGKCSAVCYGTCSGCGHQVSGPFENGAINYVVYDFACPVE